MGGAAVCSAPMLLLHTWLPLTTRRELPRRGGLGRSVPEGGLRVRWMFCVVYTVRQHATAYGLLHRLA